MYELPSGMLLKIPSEAVHENIDLSVTPIDSVPTAESQIFLTDSGKLKSMAYPCLISAYLGKATTEYKHFTEFNQYRQNAHPEDVGIGFDILDDYYTLSELINSNYHVKDSLKKNAIAHVTLFTCPPR